MPPKQDDTKDAAIYKSVMKLYEQKAYKKAVKEADKVLKAHPNHGGTTAMKALCVSLLGRRDEAMVLARAAVSYSIRNQVCWHVYGMLNRFDKNYVEAIKCYRNALRIEPDNVVVLRDLANLQTHLHDWKGLQETRRELLVSKGNNKQNWVGFILSHFLSGNYDVALEVVDCYVSTLPEDQPADSESSEIEMFKALILERKGDLSGALAHLEAKRARIVNGLDWTVRKGNLLVQLGRWEEALAPWQELVKINPENYNYHRGLQCVLLQRADLLALKSCDLPAAHVSLTVEQVDLLTSTYATLASQQPKCRAHKRIPLDFLPHDSPVFLNRLEAYIRDGAINGLPSLFSELKPLYSNAGKVQAIERILTTYITNVKASTPLAWVFPAVDGSSVVPSEQEPPSTLLWLLLLASKHFDRLGNFSRALALIDEAVEHTPTVVELYMFKARVLKHLCRLSDAAACMNTARTMDLADRYINTKTVKYKLRDGHIEDGLATYLLFAKASDLPDRQCVWFEVELGEAYLRQGALGKALKHFTMAESFYSAYREDMYDFYGYSLRNTTFSAYLEFDSLYYSMLKHRNSLRALRGAAQAYLALEDQRKAAAAAAEAAAAEGAEASKLSAAERKKQKAAARKAKAKEASAVAVAGAGAGAGAPAGGASAAAEGAVAEDEDPHGEKLVAVESALEAAKGFTTKLVNIGAQDLEGAFVVFTTAVRRGKLLQAFRAVHSAQEIDAESPITLKMVILGVQAAEAALAAEPAPAPVVARVLSELVAKHRGDTPVVEKALGVLAKHAGSIPHATAALEALVALGSPSRSAAVEAVVTAPITASKAVLPQCTHALSVLRSVGEAAAAETFRSRAEAVFPGCAVFAASA